VGQVGRAELVKPHPLRCSANPVSYRQTAGAHNGLISFTIGEIAARPRQPGIPKDWRGWVRFRTKCGFAREESVGCANGGTGTHNRGSASALGEAPNNAVNGPPGPKWRSHFG
jgi:hypothetical protein